MSTTPPSASPSCPGCWRPAAGGCASCRSREARRISPASGGPPWASSSAGATSTPWWPTTPPPRRNAATTPIPPAARRGRGPTGRSSSTAGRPIPTAPLSSAGWRPLCAGSPITTIGTTGCGPPSCWTAGRICSPSAWGRGRPWKSPAASPRGSR